MDLPTGEIFRLPPSYNFYMFWTQRLANTEKPSTMVTSRPGAF